MVPAAVLLFKLSECAILFVVVLGAAPSIANGLINGIDNIPPVLLRAGRVLGARAVSLAFRYVSSPPRCRRSSAGSSRVGRSRGGACWPASCSVLIPGKFSLGQQLDVNRAVRRRGRPYALMIVIFVIGVCMDAFVFGAADRCVRRRYGLIDTATAEYATPNLRQQPAQSWSVTPVRRRSDDLAVDEQQRPGRRGQRPRGGSRR